MFKFMSISVTIIITFLSSFTKICRYCDVSQLKTSTLTLAIVIRIGDNVSVITFENC